MKMFYISAVLFAGLSYYALIRSHNNVCTTFSDYYSIRDFNENCYHNPDNTLEIPEIIKRHGYEPEIHHVTTEDGYILSMFRILPQKMHTPRKRSVLMHHGMGLNGASFVVTGKKSLAYSLVDAGYDVWLANSRGTIFSRNHTSLSSDDLRFWNFSFHEVGVYDLPAEIDYIYKIAKEQIIYIGHSMGTTVSYVYGINFPDESAEKIKISIHLSPAAFIGNWKSVTRAFFPYWDFVEPILNWFGNGVFYPRLRVFRSKIAEFICLPYPFQMKTCHFLDMISWGFNYNQSDPETLPITLLQLSDATSVKTMTHYVQFVVSKRFQMYDYGSETNMKLYGRTEPPDYDLSKLKVPTRVIYAANDYITVKEDVEELYERLPERVKSGGIFMVEDENFNHGDFMQAKDMVPLFIRPLVKFIENL